MSPSRLPDDSQWYLALPLAERLVRRTPPPAGADQDIAKARQRLQQWKTQRPFDKEAVFQRRLALDGLTEEGLLGLLAEPAESIRDSRPTQSPRWLLQLEAALAAPPSTDTDTLHLLTGVIPPEQRSLAPFLQVILPLVEQGRARLRQGIEELLRSAPNSPFSSTVDLLFIPSLPGRLLELLHRTLVLELNVCRVQGRLQGETPQERFQHFAQLLSQREFARALLMEYPVLSRQVVTTIDQWVRFSLEFLQHLSADWPQLIDLLGPGVLQGELTGINGGMGDRHNDGRSVLFARFSSGGRLVYKPRPLDVDFHFQQLLAWLNARGLEPSFLTLKVLSRQTHGWVEFIEARSCTTEAEVERFYERQGSYLALLYALQATDFHSENLIAAGEHPVLTDLEALFHPVPPRSASTFEPRVFHEMYTSVMSVGLLPGRAWLQAGSDGLEISGLGGGLPQLWPHPTPTISRVGTDEMHIVRKQLLSAGSQNRPHLQGQPVDVTQYVGALTRGFTRLYELLVEHREALCAPNGPLARFADDEVRVVLRATYAYSLLLRESSHPNVLRDALDRDRFFDKLWLGAEDLPQLQRVLAAERADLHNGDIPIFTTRPGSRDLLDSRHERLADFFDMPALERALQHIRELRPEDLQQQLWLVRASFTTLAMGTEGSGWIRRAFQEPTVEATPERLLAGARAVGDRLAKLAVHGPQDVGWVGLTIVNDRYWSLAPTHVDLYSGNAGIALFLGYLGHVTGEARYTALARLALETARQLAVDQREVVKLIGGFGGWGGFIYALTQLAVLWKDPALLRDAEIVAGHLGPLIDKDEDLDVMNGAAGALLGLLRLHGASGSPSALAAAIRCGDRLLDTAQRMPQGLGWHVKSIAAWPLTGLSHGAGGIAWALLELATVTQDARFWEAAREALAYERSQFSAEARNWADLRVPDDTPADKRATRFSVGWCHGAPGIGLTRIKMLPHLDDPKLRLEIQAAVQTTVAQGFGRNHSLCHGDLGNLELLFQASQVFGEPELRGRTYRLAEMILDTIGAEGWLCGVPLGVETPGLMTGLAGIGLSLLRLAAPGRVPAVLTLDPSPGA
ncbi:type 2 lanthipeptide synthetase LanM family protein [Hyalangium gracile]|uniref:type 2 lanthipeptide synthetase LanM family protein n=1 Tax=Hyalangium gracile TaxID=394092 RepID=UPI001CC95107|nr:type 2 lanthipeptide synthetase LanM family protein [Hyalangium gracile]